MGRSLSINGDRFLAGDDEGDDGSAYIFLRNTSSGVWAQEARLRPGQKRAGWYVALQDDIALLGTLYSNKLYVMVRGASSWALGTTLNGPAGGFFGASCAISGQSLLVGAYYYNSQRGAAYFYERVGTTLTWSQPQLVVPPNVTSVAWFGKYLALHGDAAVIGAPEIGAAYLYVRDNTTEWRLESTVLPDGEQGELQFGRAVAVQSDVVVVGSPEESAVYIFDKVGAQMQRIASPSTKAATWFGGSVSIDDRLLLVGASGESKAYLFAATAGGYTLFEELSASTEYFGVGVALQGNVALVSALYNLGYPHTLVLFTGELPTTTTTTTTTATTTTTSTPTVASRQSTTVTSIDSTMTATEVIRGTAEDDDLEEDDTVVIVVVVAAVLFVLCCMAVLVVALVLLRRRRRAAQGRQRPLGHTPSIAVRRSSVHGGRRSSVSHSRAGSRRSMQATPMYDVVPPPQQPHQHPRQPQPQSHLPRLYDVVPPNEYGVFPQRDLNPYAVGSLRAPIRPSNHYAQGTLRAPTTEYARGVPRATTQAAYSNMS